jgi:hypothetical protein
MKSSFHFLLLLVCGLLAAHTRHDFHTSVTRMDFNPTEKSFEISIRVFTDDLERALSDDNKGQKFTLTDQDKNDAAVERYIRKHFALISPQNLKKPYAYIGKEREADATWIYVEIPFKEPLSGFSLQNDVLLDTFDDQTNLVNIKYLAQRKSYIFKKDEKTMTLGL